MLSPCVFRSRPHRPCLLDNPSGWVVVRLRRTHPGLHHWAAATAMVELAMPALTLYGILVRSVISHPRRAVWPLRPAICVPLACTKPSRIAVNVPRVCIGGPSSGNSGSGFCSLQAAHYYRAFFPGQPKMPTPRHTHTTGKGSRHMSMENRKCKGLQVSMWRPAVLLPVAVRGRRRQRLPGSFRGLYAVFPLPMSRRRYPVRIRHVPTCHKLSLWPRRIDRPRRCRPRFCQNPTGRRGPHACTSGTRWVCRSGLGRRCRPQRPSAQDVSVPVLIKPQMIAIQMQAGQASHGWIARPLARRGCT